MVFPLIRIRGLFWGDPKDKDSRILGLCWGPPILENYHFTSELMGHGGPMVFTIEGLGIGHSGNL